MEQLPVRQRKYPDSGDVVLEPQPRPLPGGYFELPPGDDAGNDWSRWLQYLDTLMRHKVASWPRLCGLILARGVQRLSDALYSARARHWNSRRRRRSSNRSRAFPIWTQRSVSDADAGAAAQKQHAPDVASAKKCGRIEQSVAPATQAPGQSVPGERCLGSFAPRWQARRRQPGWEEAVAYAMCAAQITPVKDSRIVQITTESTVPQVAADYVNTVASEFIKQTVEDRWSLYQSTSTGSHGPSRI